MPKRSLSIVAVIMATVAALTASVAVAGTVTGNDGMSLSADARIKPKNLSKTVPTAAALDLRTKTTTSGTAGTLNPVVKAVMDFDKNGTYATKGLPTCGEKALLGKGPEEAEKICGKAGIGGGQVTATVELIEGSPVEVSAELSAFNGVPKGGKPTVVLYAYTAEPVLASYVFTGVVSNYRKEGYGSRFEIDFPPLFGGDGALREFKLKIEKKFTYKGKERSLVSGKCPGSKKLKARIAFTYKNGETLTAPSTQSCTPQS
jgi:hypothetical protein